MDNKSAQGKLSWRLARIAKAHGFEKIDGEYQCVVNDVVQLFDQARYWRQPEGSYTFDVDLKVFSPGFCRRVYGNTVNPVYYFQLQAPLSRLVGHQNGWGWIAPDFETLAVNLDDLELRFAEFGLPFLAQSDSESSVVERYRTGGPFGSANRALADWTVACYEGNATLHQRPVPLMVRDPKFDKYLKGPEEFCAPILEQDNFSLRNNA